MVAINFRCLHNAGFPPPFSEPHSSNEPSKLEMSMESRAKQCLQALPEELLQYIVEHLDNYGLSGFSLAAKWCHELASSVRWREVTLTDCSRTHANSLDSHLDAEVVDDHDDTPLLRKLIVLATYVRCLKVSYYIANSRIGIHH